MERIKKTVELLNSKDENFDNGVNTCRAIELCFNCCGSFSSIANQIFEALSKSGKKKLLACLSIAAMDMAHRYDFQHGDVWDDRVKASMSFSSKNIRYFKDLFEKETGCVLTVNPDNDLYFPHCVSWEKEFRDSYVRGFVSEWNNAHSTLKQSFFGGMVRGVLMEQGASFVPPLNYDSIVFPFI